MSLLIFDCRKTPIQILSLDHPLPPLENGYYPAAVKDKLIKLELCGLTDREIDMESSVVMKLRLGRSGEFPTVECARFGGYWYLSSMASAFTVPYSSTHRYFDRGCGSCLIIRGDLARSGRPISDPRGRCTFRRGRLPVCCQ